jgi:hypothetical protein
MGNIRLIPCVGSENQDTGTSIFPTDAELLESNRTPELASTRYLRLLIILIFILPTTIIEMEEK